MNISAVIPVYNRETTIRRALDSVLRQTLPPDEIIVTDDGSVDGTPEILKSYGSAIKIIRTANRGVSAARNTAIDRSSGTWIALLDSDDEWLPHKLEMQAEYLGRHPGLKICQSGEIWIRNGRRVNPMKKHLKPEGDIFFPSLKMCLVSPSAVIFQKLMFESVGGFDEDLPVCEDYDLWLRISLNYSVGLVPGFGIRKYGGHPDQLSSAYWGMDRFRIKSLEKLIDNNVLDPVRLAEVLSVITAKLKVLINGAEKRNHRCLNWKMKLKKYELLQLELENNE